MSQTPTPDSPQQPESSQPTQPLWYGEPSRSSLRPSVRRRPRPDPRTARRRPASRTPHRGGRRRGHRPAAPGAAAAGGRRSPPSSPWPRSSPAARRTPSPGGDVTADTSIGAAGVDQPSHSSPPPVAQANARPRLERHRRRRLPQRRGDHRQEQRGRRPGSGVLFDAKGHIVTNNHVVGGGRWPVPALGDALRRPHLQRHVVGTDPSTDLAVIKLDNAPSDLTPIRARRRRRAQGRRPGDGRRQPARPGRHRHDRHRQRAEPAGDHQPGRPAAGPVRPEPAAGRAGRDQRDPDHRRDQPGQQRRCARQRQWPARRHQLLDRLRRLLGHRLPERQHRHRLRHPGQRGDLDRRPADRGRQGRARLPRGQHPGRHRQGRHRRSGPPRR